MNQRHCTLQRQCKSSAAAIGLFAAAVSGTYIGTAALYPCPNTGRLGGSFFFKRRHTQRGTWHGLLATLAY
ncbi:hypothetical protein C8J57DRAFT_1093296 [Mycena rebaudengoi]|nr:hypothetical protein C8J57DRAFT_1093296 [Mycena rebaudengoi]